MQWLYSHDLAPQAPVFLKRNGDFAINGRSLAYTVPRSGT
jgi:hypothetical protein